MAFHDSWPSGQLLSRAVSDLTTIRRFLAFVGIYVVVNTLSIVVGLAILIALAPSLGLLVAVMAVPLMVLCLRYERRFELAARRAQDQVGDLATTVEEAALGIRVLKAFGRGRTAPARCWRRRVSCAAPSCARSGCSRCCGGW